MRSMFQMGAVALLTLVLCTTASAADWGNLKGKFIYDGTPPEAKPIKVTKDQPVCGNHNLVDESLVVNKESKGLKNVIIYLYPGRGDKVKVHESYAALEGKEIEVDNNQCRFNPHVTLLWTKQKLVIGNADPVGHNTKVDTFSNPPTNFTVPAGGSLKQTFKKEERMPAQIGCSIHPWMRGWLVVRDTPYMAVSDEDGNFEIKNLPTGKWEFLVWQEAASSLKSFEVDGKTVKPKRGRWTLTIKEGDNDVGDIKVDPALFK